MIEINVLVTENFLFFMNNQKDSVILEPSIHRTFIKTEH